MNASGGKGKHRRRPNGGAASGGKTRGGERRVRQKSHFRSERVAAQLQREVGRLLHSDRRCRCAVRPEEMEGQEGAAITALASCTGVELSSDLSIATVSVSIMSDETGREAAWRRLRALNPHIRMKIAQKMGHLRRVPEIRLVEDDGIMESARVLSILDSIQEEREQLEERRKLYGDSGFVWDDDDDDKYEEEEEEDGEDEYGDAAGMSDGNEENEERTPLKEDELEEDDDFSDVFIMRLPLLGLEDARILGKIRKQHTVTILSVVEKEVEPSSSSPSSEPVRLRRRRRCRVFDVVPANATNVTTILRLMGGQAVPATVRSRSMRLNLENATYVGRASRVESSLATAIERADEFNARWPRSLSLFDDKTSCRHHTMLLVADIMQLEPTEVWSTYRLGTYLNF